MMSNCRLCGKAAILSSGACCNCLRGALPRDVANTHVPVLLNKDEANILLALVANQDDTLKWVTAPEVLEYRRRLRGLLERLAIAHAQAPDGE